MGPVTDLLILIFLLNCQVLVIDNIFSEVLRKSYTPL
jgi:hypothetical protein